MKRLLFSLAAILLTAVSVSAQETITFEDSYCFYACWVQNGYHGLNWSNMAFLNATEFNAQHGPSGYSNGLVSGDWVVFNNGGEPASILQGSTPFTLNSGYFTAAWNDGLMLAVTGVSGGLPTYFASFTLNTSGPSLLTFDWTNLDYVQFAPSGGTPHGFYAKDDPYFLEEGTHFALDDLTVTAAVVSPAPEPASMTLLGTGLVGVMGIVRRRRNAAGNHAST